MWQAGERTGGRRASATALGLEGAVALRQICVLQLAVALAAKYSDKNGRISDAKKVNSEIVGTSQATCFIFFFTFPCWPKCVLSYSVAKTLRISFSL